MSNYSFLSENWFMLLLFSFAIVATINALVASTSRRFYQKVPIGRLSHSQLRVKQGTASLEHRFNVFAHSLFLGIFKFRIYILAILLWISLNLLIYYHIIRI